MKPIEQNEIYEHFSQFLKNRGIELKKGGYAKGIQKGCGLLAEAINLSQRGIEKAKTGIDEKIEQVRQVIHEKTAPKSGAAAPGTEASAAKKPARGTPNAARKKASRKPKASRKRKRS